MKNLLGYAFFILSLFTGLSASSQIPQGKTASTTLNVTLANVYDIQIGQSSVSIKMNSPIHFTAGNNSGKQTGHLSVSCNTGYEVKVSASTELLNGTSSIPVNTITVKPELGAFKGMGTAPSVTDVTLMETPLYAAGPKTIILKNTGESKREYDVDYSISALTANAYMNKIPGNYSTTVTYSLFSK
jgi:hypothetical protein